MEVPRRSITLGKLVIGGLAMLLAVRLAFLQGIVAPVRISGGSMGPNLPGEYFSWGCEDCRFPCRWDAAAPPGNGQIVCPNCGFVNRDVSGAKRRTGRRVWIDRWPSRFGRLRRFDLVALPDPADAERLAVKRLVALPGESPAIRNGDLFLGDRIVQKSFEQFRSLAVLVHDADFEPKSAAAVAARWVPLNSVSGWQAQPGEFSFQPSAMRDELDWLVYRNLRGFSAPFPRNDEFPVLDNDAFNPDSSRQLNRVADLSVSCQVQVEGAGGCLGFAYRDAHRPLEIRCWPDRGELELLTAGEIAETAPFPQLPLAQGVQFEFAVYDQRIVLAVEGRPMFCRDLPAATEPAARPSLSSRPLAIGASGSRVTFRRLRVWRDIVWLAPHGQSDDWRPGRTLADGECWVFGDNPPVSDDSRRWPPGAVRRKSLLGQVLP